MLMVLAALAAWGLMVLSMSLFPTADWMQPVLLFAVPVLTAILMCRGNRKHEIPLDGTVFGGCIWVILNVCAGAVLSHLAEKKTFYAYETAEEWKGAQIFCWIFTAAIAVLPPLAAVIWRIILNIRERVKK